MDHHWQQMQRSQGALKEGNQPAETSNRDHLADLITTVTASEAPTFDITTGLEDRDSYFRYLRSLNQPDNMPGQMAIQIVDLDHFRVINHSLGVNAGDQILASVGKRIRNTINHKVDRAFRVSGNEFAVVTPIMPGDWGSTESDATAVAHRYALALVEAITKPHILSKWPDGKGRDVIHRGGVSVGVALLGTEVRDGLATHEKATMAMRKAKRAGGGRIQLFNKDVKEFSQDFRLRRQMETALREAVKNKTLTVVYQAQVDENGRSCSAEALLRWTCPHLGPISPSTFIKLGEELGLIGEMGAFVLETTCRQIAAWSDPKKSRLSALPLSVNVSPLQFHDDNLDQTVAHILEKTGADPTKLTLEITESALMDDVEHARQVLDTLRQIGVGVSLDDFGTGYTSFEHLRNLPITEIKIDRSFIHRITTDTHDRIIARTILELGHAMGVEVVAEGFEKAEQVNQLREMGCRRFQGFHFARPLPPADFERFISN